MTEAVVEKPGREARFIGLLRTFNGTMRRSIGIANTITGKRAGSAAGGGAITA